MYEKISVENTIAKNHKRIILPLFKLSICIKIKNGMDIYKKP